MWVKTSPLTQGYSAIVDDRDYKRVSQYPWSARVKYRADGTIRTVYAVRHAGVYVSLHRFILRLTDPAIQVDHRNGDGLDCQRHNMRKTQTQNPRNARKTSSPTSSKFKGVHKCGTRWRGQISFHGKHVFLGYHHTEEAAARAYDAAALKYYGEFALTNVMLGLLTK